MDSNAFLVQMLVAVRGVAKASSELNLLRGSVEGINRAAAQTAPLREAAGTLAGIGIGLGAAGAAIGYGPDSIVQPAIRAEAQLAHIRTAMGATTDTAQHLAQANSALTQMSKTEVGGVESLRGAYYDAISTNLDYKQGLAAVKAGQDLAVATADSLADAQNNLAPGTRLLGTLFQNFGDKTEDAVPQMRQYADQLAVIAPVLFDVPLEVAARAPQGHVDRDRDVSAGRHRRCARAEQHRRRDRRHHRGASWPRSSSGNSRGSRARSFEDGN